MMKREFNKDLTDSGNYEDVFESHYYMKKRINFVINMNILCFYKFVKYYIKLFTKKNK